MIYKTIKSKRYGDVVFFMRHDGGYVRMEDHKGRCNQICYGGCFDGNTISATPETFEADVQRWWRSRREFLNDMGSY